MIEDGQEGAILRKADMSYEHKRSKNLLKVKPEEDSEARLIELHYGTGNWGSVYKTATLDWNGKIFDATFKASQEECEEITKHPEKWLNKIVTFNYWGLTGKNCPQYANISPANCFK